MMKTRVNTEKVAWSGRIVSIQPRIRLMRSFDERSHSYLRYVLRVEGTIGDEPAGRKGMSYTEEDWVDEDATAHRGPGD